MYHKIYVDYLQPLNHDLFFRFRNILVPLLKVCFWPVCFIVPTFLLSSIFALRALAEPPGPGSGPLPLVRVVEVTSQNVNPAIEYVGHVEAVQSVDLRARVQGFLEQVKFKEGSYVRAGDLLYVIEQAPYKTQVDADKANVIQTKATLSKARSYLQRVKEVSSGLISENEIDNAVADELRARGELEEAQANLERSELDLEYTTVMAPISGRIGRTAFTRGNLVGPESGPLARIVQIDPIRVVYSISENDLAAVETAIKDAINGKKRHPMLRPQIRLLNGQIFKNKGKIDFVNNTVDPNTGTIAVWAVFDNQEGTLLPGQYVTVLVSRSEPKMKAVVPQSAVLDDRQGRYVLVVNDQDRVVMRRIKTGFMIGINWAVESGLSVGEKVIVEGVLKVRPGQLVKTTVAAEEKTN